MSCILHKISDGVLNIYTEYPSSVTHLCLSLSATVCWQAAYTALQEFEAQFPSTGEEVVRLKEEIYALLEERAQHAAQRKWRQMQKKQASDSAAANARNQRRSSMSEAAAQSSVVSLMLTSVPAGNMQLVSLGLFDPTLAAVSQVGLEIICFLPALCCRFIKTAEVCFLVQDVLIMLHDKSVVHELPTCTFAIRLCLATSTACHLGKSPSA